MYDQNQNNKKIHQNVPTMCVKEHSIICQKLPSLICVPSVFIYPLRNKNLSHILDNHY